MKKIYNSPIVKFKHMGLKHSILEHSEGVPGDEGDEFNARRRHDEIEEEVEPTNWGDTQNSLW